MKCGWRAIFVAVLVLGLPWVGTATTIYDVQYNETNQGSGDDCYPSPLDGQQVTISGIDKLSVDAQLITRTTY